MVGKAPPHLDCKNTLETVNSTIENVIRNVIRNLRRHVFTVCSRVRS